MSKKIIAVLAVVVVAIVAVAAVFMLTGNDEKKDTYYVFVDGTGTVDGWYTGEGTTVIDGVKNAFDNGKVKYKINDKGWIVSIDGKESDSKNKIGYGIFEYTSTSVESPYMGYFVTGPVITDCVGNILYITYSEYDFNGKFGNNVYKVCPTDTPNGNKLKNGGPFTDKDYKPLEYKSPFYLYLAGFDGKTNGWYKCEGKDMLSAIESTMKAKNIDFTVKNGWIISIDGKESDSDKNIGFEVRTYGSSNLSSPDAGYFLLGSGIADSIGTIAYIAYTQYEYNTETGVITYDIVPDKNTIKDGPFGS